MLRLIIARRGAAAAAVLCAFGVLGGCGKAASSGSGESARGGAQTQHPQTEVVPFPRPGKRAIGEGRCDRAVVRAGDRPGSLDVKSRCFSPRVDGRGEIVISQFVANGGVTPIVDYSRKPEVSGRQRHLGVGHCGRLYMGVRCEAPIHDRAIMHARIWVDPGTRCKRRILVISTAEPSCRSARCSHQVTSHQLFRGRPQGC